MYGPSEGKGIMMPIQVYKAKPMKMINILAQ